MGEMKQLLSGGDRRSLGRSAALLRKMRSVTDVNQLFPLIYSDDRVVAMRTIDTLEKFTRNDPASIRARGDELIQLARNTQNKEIKWHIAQLLPRIGWSPAQLRRVFSLLNYWTSNPHESKIVRSNALEAMHRICVQSGDKRMNVLIRRAIRQAERSGIPSLEARARKLRRT